ncbi:CRISPR/Cas system-associated endoribonuclease Cas2 [Microvirga lupini]|uniref:CRISPR/Cas system-associated endoribonuclease Cas2 n=1 Tax=Microvirga lupini TaxID=420324 RepID=A0A7W4VNZ8_9HYPH|nr:CRISPR/Cas system-associated endoribonuclease Cas2 [Microvirga lupini]
MGLYLVSYDLREERNYDPLYECLAAWNASRLLKSVWLVKLDASAAAIRDHLNMLIDSDDGTAVIELKHGCQWACHKPEEDGVAWLRANARPA